MTAVFFCTKQHKDFYILSINLIPTIGSNVIYTNEQINSIKRNIRVSFQNPVFSITQIMYNALYDCSENALIIG